MRSFVLVAAIILSPIVLAGPAQVDGNLTDSVVVVHNGDTEGTGFLISGDYVLTNRHVVSGPGSRDIQVGFGGFWSDARLLKYGDTRDLALLKPGSVPEASESLSIHQGLEKNERVKMAGNLHGRKLNVREGKIVGRNRTVDTSSVEIRDSIVFSAPVYNGDSGAPLVDSDGKVVGVVTARRGSSRGYAIPSAAVKEFLPNVSKTQGN